MEKCEYLKKMGEKDWKKIRRKCTVIEHSKRNNSKMIVPNMHTCLHNCLNIGCPLYSDATYYVNRIRQAVSNSIIGILEE